MRCSDLNSALVYIVGICAMAAGVSLVDSVATAGVANAAPPPPRLISPVQGLAVPFYALRLTVENVLGPGYDPVFHDYQIFADSLLTEQVRSADSVRSGPYITLSSEFNDLQNGRRYWWRARSQSAQGSSEWSEAESFSTRAAQARYVPATQESIAGAIVHSWDGDTVLVGPGRADLWFGLQIFNYRVVVKSQHGPQSTFLDYGGEGRVIRIGDVGHGAPGHGAVLEGFTIKCHRATAIFSDRAEYDLVNCVFDSTEGYVISTVRSRLTISRCDFRPGGEYTGIYLFQSELEAHHNLFQGGTAQPLVYVQESSARVWNNTFANCFTGVGLVYNGSPVECFNNIFYGLGNYALAGSLATVDEDYNLFFHNSQNTVGEIRSGGHSIFADPLFSNAERGLFTLNTSSPAIDAGHPDSAYRDSDGSIADIGAFGVWERPHLISPLDDTVRTLLPRFEWSAVPLDQIAYTVVVSEDSIFRTSEARMVSSSSLQWTTSLQRGVRYYWRILAYSNTGSRYQTAVSTFVTAPPFVPVAYALHRNYPNPFNSQTVIPLDLPEESEWSISIHNVLGQVVWATSGHDGAGRKLVSWDGRGLDGWNAASGIYLYKVKIGSFEQARKMTLVR